MPIPNYHMRKSLKTIMHNLEQADPETKTIETEPTRQAQSVAFTV